MTQFPDSIHHHWQLPFVGTTLYHDAHLRVVINPALEADEGVTILHTVSNAHTQVALLPAIADALHTAGHLNHTGVLTETALRNGLAHLGIHMHSADGLYYATTATREQWLSQNDAPHLRQLQHDDEMLLATLEYQSSDHDLDNAQITIEDWAVFGVITSDQQLLSVASIYPWGGPTLLDIGVLTLNSARGKGYGRQLVQAAGRFALQHNGELQYRSQTDNHASIALAKAACLTLFGYWEIPTPQP